jgi:hypothetical protein
VVRAGLGLIEGWGLGWGNSSRELLGGKILGYLDVWIGMLAREWLEDWLSEGEETLESFLEEFLCSLISLLLLLLLLFLLFLEDFDDFEDFDESLEALLFLDSPSCFAVIASLANLEVLTCPRWDS